MAKRFQTVNERSRRVGGTQQERRQRGRRDGTGRDPHAKGTMREPAQIPSGKRGALQEVQEALEDLEKKEGDWSKGG